MSKRQYTKLDQGSEARPAFACGHNSCSDHSETRDRETSLGKFVLVVTAFVACLTFGTAAHSQANATGQLDAADAALLQVLRVQAENGDADSAFQLGVAYLEPDPTEAEKWLRLAADQNHAEAQALLDAADAAMLQVLQVLRVQAENGDADSAFRLGMAYIEPDATEAVKWLRLAAEQEHAEAQALLGRLYYVGQGVPRDVSESLRWYRRAIEQDDPTAQLYLGLLYYNGHGVPKDEARAARWIRRAADQGDAEAQYEMGGMSSVGAGVPQSYTEAARWYRLASEQGYGDAQFVLWLYYHEGRGVAKDPVEAARWLRMAAEQGHVESQAKLGTLYMVGDGVPQDVEKAERWLRAAAQQDYALTIEMLEDTLNALAELESTVEAATRPNATADTGDAEELYRLARMYDSGDGVEEDDVEAMRLYLLAAAQGHSGAAFELGLNYDIGHGVEEDDAEAVSWYRLAAAQGHSRAQFSLGLRHAVGDGVAQDHAEAARFFRLAAEQGHSAAQFALGSSYGHGVGVEHDFGEALRWYRLAAKNGHDDAAERLRSMETWRCFDGTDFNRTNALLTLTRLEHSGGVSIGGTTYSTAFEVRGLDRRWDFGPDGDGSFNYMFRIEPDGTGVYYDFSRSTDGTASPRQTYECEVSVGR